ncbi:MAG: hypothetical protein GC160_03830 [Acidobacteria bacterium]|nr:hypothetical protein [Acidobacteriota bacterium]
MSPGELSVLEEELLTTPPRSVRLTAAGRKEFLFPALGILALLSACGWAYSSRPAPGALMPLFVCFTALGAYLLVRVLEAWHERACLVRDGRTARAVVVAAAPAKGRQRRFVGWYEAGGKQWSLEWLDAEDSAEIGDSLTALYLPGEPGRAVLYRLAGCRAEAPAADAAAPDHSPLTPRI